MDAPDGLRVINAEPKPAQVSASPPAQATVGETDALWLLPPAADIPRRMSPIDVLALQRAVGNQAISSLVSPSSTRPEFLAVQRAPSEQEFSPEETTQLRTRITTGRNSAQAFNDKFQGFLDNTAKFISAYREKTKWVNGAYELAYGHHTTLVSQLGANALGDQDIVNLAVGLALNVLTGGVAEILEAMEVIGHAAAFIGDQLVNTVVGVAVAPNFPNPVSTATSAPAFKALQGFKKLDELNKDAFDLARDGSRQISAIAFEAAALSDALVASQGDPAHIERNAFDKRMDALGKAFTQIPQASASVDAGQAKLEALWRTFFQSPWPDDRKCEQDIWVVWMAEQKTYDNPEMPRHEGLLGQFDEAITPKLLRSTKLQDHMMAIGGDAAEVASHNLDTMIKFSAESHKSGIAKYWASVFME